MSTLTPEDRARLRDLAAKATPGPWVRTGRDGRDYSLSPATGALLVDYAPIKQKCADAVYIAAADPATVTALLDALDAAEAERAEAWGKGHRTPWVREPDECECGAWSSNECGCGLYGTGRIVTTNPYRQETDR